MKLAKTELKDLKPICRVLDLEVSGTREELAQRIVDYAVKPSSSGSTEREREEKRELYVRVRM